MARIGFVGLGNMGGPMARNLLKAGHEVAAFDIVPEAVRRAGEAGAIAAGSAADAARGAAFVIDLFDRDQIFAQDHIMHGRSPSLESGLGLTLRQFRPAGSGPEDAGPLP